MLPIFEPLDDRPVTGGEPGALSRAASGEEAMSVVCGDSRRVLLHEVEWGGDTMSGMEFGRRVGGEKGGAFEESLG